VSHGVIDSMATGTYAVTRRTDGTYDSNGKFVSGTMSSFDIRAVVQPASGRDLAVAVDVERYTDTRTVYTRTELKCRGPGFESDTVSIDGEGFLVINSKKHEGLGGSHWKALVGLVIRD
jgi:hypothetical protein